MGKSSPFSASSWSGRYMPGVGMPNPGNVETNWRGKRCAQRNFLSNGHWADKYTYTYTYTYIHIYIYTYIYIPPILRLCLNQQCHTTNGVQSRFENTILYQLHRELSSGNFKAPFPHIFPYLHHHFP
jgi:hypothetical protein